MKRNKENHIMNTSNSTSFETVRGMVAVDEHVPCAGAIIWWRLSGTIDIDALKAAWLQEGMPKDELPSPCTPATALRRATNVLREKRVLVRPLGRANGFAVVRERVVHEGSVEKLAYDTLASVNLDAVGRVEVLHHEPVGDRTAHLENLVRAAFDFALDQLEPEDISSWLCKMLPRLDAVGLRDSGGVYFVPYASTEKVAAVARVLRTVSQHVINRVPAMRSDDAVAAILDAITQEAEAEAVALEKVIEEGKLGERGMENRVAHCDAVESKVARYEALLGTKLDTVRERLEALRVQLTVATLKGAGEGVS